MDRNSSRPGPMKPEGCIVPAFSRKRNRQSKRPFHPTPQLARRPEDYLSEQSFQLRNQPANTREDLQARNSRRSPVLAPELRSPLDSRGRALGPNTPDCTASLHKLPAKV